MVYIRHAERVDIKELALLLEELDRFYGETEFEPTEERISKITDALFGTPRASFTLLAWENDSLVGMASYSFMWPAVGVTRSLYLKELYVRQARQRSGIGTTLMNELREVAIAHQCSRVEWTAESGNRNAHKFYQALGATRNEEKSFYRIVM